MIAFLARRVIRLGVVASLSAVWTNRRDIRRWASFFARTIRERGTRPWSEVVTEFRARLAISSDARLRHAPGLYDLSLSNGVVTIYTNRANRLGFGDLAARVSDVRGVNDVQVASSAIPAASTATDPDSPTLEVVTG